MSEQKTVILKLRGETLKALESLGGDLQKTVVDVIGRHLAARDMGDIYVKLDTGELVKLEDKL